MRSLPLKYVIDSNDRYVIFSAMSTVAHLDFRIVMSRPIVSAGFMKYNRVNNKITCNGMSVTLNINSRPDIDVEFFTKHLAASDFKIVGCLSPFNMVFASNIPFEELNYGWDVEILEHHPVVDDIVYL